MWLLDANMDVHLLALLEQFRQSPRKAGNRFQRNRHHCQCCHEAPPGIAATALQNRESWTAGPTVRIQVAASTELVSCTAISVSSAAGKAVRPPVYPPTYSNTPTPWGDFTGPSFGPSVPDRFPLMQQLQGTLFGSLLDSNRTSLTGWIDMSYNASTARHDNRPMGFDFRAFCDRKSNREKNILDFLEHLADQMMRANRAYYAGERKIDAIFCGDMAFRIGRERPALGFDFRINMFAQFVQGGPYTALEIG